LGACNAPSRYFLPHARRYCLDELVIFCIKLCFCMVTDIPFQAQECLLSLESYSQMEIQVTFSCSHPLSLLTLILAIVECRVPGCVYWTT
jgi:hypothetical protein